MVKIQSKEIGTQIDWGLYVLIGKRVNRLCRVLSEDPPGLVSIAMLSQIFGKTRFFIRF